MKYTKHQTINNDKTHTCTHAFLFNSKSVNIVFQLFLGFSIYIISRGYFVFEHLRRTDPRRI